MIYIYIYIFTGFPSFVDLQKTVNHLLKNSLRENTRKTYCSAQNRYLQFCNLYQQNPIPASENTLMLYVAYLYYQHLTYSTVQVYLSAVRSLHIFHGYGNPLDNKLLLKQTVKAVHVIRGDCTQKLPITLEILQKMYRIVSTFHGAQVLWAAMTLAFFGCLRSAELTVRNILIRFYTCVYPM